MEVKKISVKVKKLHPDAKIPTSGSEHAAGFDLYSCEECTLAPGEFKKISTGIAVEIPGGKVLLLWDRSGMGSKGIHRFAGVIDSDYRGEIKVVLCNHTQELFHINTGDRIVQGVIQDYYKAEFQEVIELSSTERGEKGFGSSGN
jgi:dUTP pyrophosphatase